MFFSLNRVLKHPYFDTFQIVGAYLTANTGQCA